MQLVEGVLAGNRLALSRLMTYVENDAPEGYTALDHLFPHTGKAHLIGVTGSPGTGKSSLVNQLARLYRHPVDDYPAHRVGIVAVDPTSPFTGGAILGDRVRMRDLAGDPDVFIRSMATRGALGGLAYKTSAVVQLLDAAGFEVIFIETVGAGQSEVEIARLAHTTLVVEAPGLGDDIQAIKAGILEIADILVVNKADKPGVDHTVRALQSMLNLAASNSKPNKHRSSAQPSVQLDEPDPERWVPPIHKTTAINREGIEELFRSLQNHKAYLKRTSEWERRGKARLRRELDELLQTTLLRQWQSRIPHQVYQATLERLEKRELSPYRALAYLMKSG